MYTRYDVELYQRIEQLIGKKLPLHATVEEEVMSLMERVSEAQRHAKMVRNPSFLEHKCLNISFSLSPVSDSTYHFCLQYCLEMPAMLIWVVP